MSRMLTFSSTSAVLGVISIRGEGARTTVALGAVDVGVASGAVGDAVGGPAHPVAARSRIKEPRMAKTIDLLSIIHLETLL